MKVRISIAAVLLASIAGLGFSLPAFAARSCLPIDGENGEREVVACTSAYSVDASVPLGGSVVVTPVNDYTTLPNPPKVDFLDLAITVSVLNSSGMSVNTAQMEICFADASATGNVYLWNPTSSSETLYSAKLTGMWQYVSTFHPAGMDCVQTELAGTYTIN